MHADADTLTAACLEMSGVTAAVQQAAGHATLELFHPSGELLHVTTVTALDASRVRGAWTLPRPDGQPVLVAIGTTIGVDADVPLIRIRRRRRQVSARVRRVGPFWIAEALGRRLRVTIDDGLACYQFRGRRRLTSLRIRVTASTLTPSTSPRQESL